MTQNRLAQERSPYLRQHRSNPVDWHPWGEEALRRAQEEDLPIFLSVGYAACHWCHVMEHESFEDEVTAALLNGAFVCVKVDREERPDLDALYMRAVHLVAGRGGWPMTVLLTPEGDPFFAGTYFPRPQLQQIVRRVEELWRSERSKLREQARMVSDRLRSLAGGLPDPGPGLDLKEADLLGIADAALAAAFDLERGGYGGAPKFPPHAELLYLLDRARLDGSASALAQARRTLEGMAAGGVHDHVGGGFHRYSTDAVWFVPHFEKMLYDNALLARAYARFHEITGEERFADVARGILEWVEREMARPEGGYASSLDADTEGEEGTTYTWTLDEVRAVLVEEGDDAAFVAERYGVLPGGNYREEATGRPTGRNILHLRRPLDDADRERAAALLPRLREARDARPQPGLDDKVITAWNGLLLSAFARCGAAFEDARIFDRGRALAEFLWAACRRDDGVLLRFPCGSGADIVAFCEDHVHLAEGLLDLAEATGDRAFAERARELGDALLAHFADEQRGGFWSTSDTWHEALVTRQKETFDSPIPSDNGTAARLLLRLGALFGEERFRKAAERTLEAWRPLLGQSRSAAGTVALYRALADRSRAAPEAEASPAADATSQAGPLQAEAYAERVEVRAGSEVRVAVRVTLREGWHADSPDVTGEDLVSVEVPTILDEGPSWIRGRLAVGADAASGPLVAGLVLTFQPCTDTECQAPRKVRLDLRLEVGEADGPARHTAVFG